MNGTDNGDGTYTCELTAETVNGYTAETAPIVMPINTPGYSAMSALTDYSSSAKTYTERALCMFMPAAVDVMQALPQVLPI